MAVQVVINVRNMELGDRLQDYITKKVAKLDRYLDTLEEAKVDLTYVKSARSASDRQVAQLTIRGKGVLLRAEERTDDIFASVDAVLAKIYRQIERYKGKHWRSRGDGRSAADVAPDVPEAQTDLAETDEIVVRRKRFMLTPMNVREAIEQVLGEFRDQRYNKMMIYRRCIERGVLSKSECSQTSFFRLAKEYDLLLPASQTQNKRRLAFSKEYANEMWQLDTMFGPYMKNGRTSTQVKLIAFIDDASRIVPHGQFFFSENTDHLITALRSALYKRGIPQTHLLQFAGANVRIS